MARPVIYKAEDVNQSLNDYIDSTDNPMMQEFCAVKGNPSDDTIYALMKDYKPLSATIKRLHRKQEQRTINLVESGQLNPVWAIFKLKQPCYGWTDKQQVESINLNVDADLSETEADRILKAAGLRIESEPIEQLETVEDDE